MTICETFHDLLHEFLDGALDARLQAFAQQHLAQCDSCRRVFLGEQASAKKMKLSLEQATAGISMRPQMRQDIIRALAAAPAGQSAWQRGWKSVVLLLMRPTGVAAALLGVILLSIGLRFRRPEARDSTSKAIAPSGPYVCVITVPLQTQTHFFQRRNDTIEDAVVSGASIGSAGLFEPKP
jgi:anti-sigma factor RsiW